MPDTELLLFASELRTRAEEILVRAANTDDLEAQKTIPAVAADYQQLVQRAEQRVREVRQ
jgi:hypothetical protein